MPVHVGDVYTVQGARANKAQALKILEEAAEVFAAWQVLSLEFSQIGKEAAEEVLVSEIADLITAACGMIAGLGFWEAAEAFELCKMHNEKRGRVME